MHIHNTDTAIINKRFHYFDTVYFQMQALALVCVCVCVCVCDQLIDLMVAEP